MKVNRCVKCNVTEVFVVCDLAAIPLAIALVITDNINSDNQVVPGKLNTLY
jgi:hypothetical protein